MKNYELIFFACHTTPQNQTFNVSINIPNKLYIPTDSSYPVIQNNRKFYAKDSSGN